MEFLPAVFFTGRSDTEIVPLSPSFLDNNLETTEEMGTF